jgi:hypothetical protein
MAGELRAIQDAISKIGERAKAGKPFELVLINKKVEDDQEMIRLKPNDVKKIRPALLRIDDATGTFREQAATKPLDLHLETGDKLAFNVKTKRGAQYYLLHPLDFSSFTEDPGGKFFFVVGSFRMFQSM